MGSTQSRRRICGLFEVAACKERDKSGRYDKWQVGCLMQDRKCSGSESEPNSPDPSQNRISVLTSQNRISVLEQALIRVGSSAATAQQIPGKGAKQIRVGTAGAITPPAAGSEWAADAEAKRCVRCYCGADCQDGRTRHAQQSHSWITSTYQPHYHFYRRF